MVKGLRLRGQLVAGIAAVQLAMLALAAGFLLANARAAVEVEIAAAERSARALVLAALGPALSAAPPDAVLPRLSRILVEPRHVDLTLVDVRRGTIPLAARAAREPGAAAVPGWFAALMTPPPRVTRVPVRPGGVPAGFVLMRTDAGDEIAEVWHDARALAWIGAATALASTLLAAILVSRALGPLGRLRAAMAGLRAGQLGGRLGETRSADLRPIFAGFDALAHGLQTAERNRAELNRRLVELGDAERRAIAMELHDEFGPCLFGLRVKATSIARGAAGTSAAADADAILDIVAQIQASNARLLTTLRPMAIGQLPLACALADLFAAFRKTHPGIDWRIDLPDSLPQTSETVDLTIYRAFQEAVTNALRHGRPRRIEATLRQAGEGLQVIVSDDGVGLSDQAPEGRGLTAMRDRIGAIGGRVALGRTAAGGTRLVARIPWDRATVAPPLEAAS